MRTRRRKRQAELFELEPTKAEVKAEVKRKETGFMRAYANTVLQGKRDQGEKPK